MITCQRHFSQATFDIAFLNRKSAATPLLKKKMIRIQGYFCDEDEIELPPFLLFNQEIEICF